MQDQFRVFKNGTGSYDIVAPKIKELLKQHRSRPIGARVTLTSQTLDVKRIFQHLTEEIGFWEVGFAPVTTAPATRLRHQDGGFDQHARPVPSSSPRSFSTARAGKPASWIFERQGHARRDPQRRQQGLSLRRRVWG